MHQASAPWGAGDCRDCLIEIGEGFGVVLAGGEELLPFEFQCAGSMLVESPFGGHRRRGVWLRSLLLIDRNQGARGVADGNAHGGDDGGDGGGFEHRADQASHGGRENRTRRGACQPGTEEIHDLAFEKLPASRELLANGRFALRKGLGDSSHRLIFPVVEDHREAVFFEKGIEHGEDEGLLIASDRDFVGTRFLIDDRSVQEVGRALFFYVIQGGIARDPDEPGTEFFGLLERPELLPCDHKGFLRGVLAEGKIAENGEGSAVDEILVAMNDLDEGLFVSPARCLSGTMPRPTAHRWHGADGRERSSSASS